MAIPYDSFCLKWSVCVFIFSCSPMHLKSPVYRLTLKRESDTDVVDGTPLTFKPKCWKMSPHIKWMTHPPRPLVRELCFAELTTRRLRQWGHFTFSFFFPKNCKSCPRSKRDRDKNIFILVTAVFWEHEGPVHCVFMNSYCGCHHFHIMLAEKCHTEGNWIWDINSVFLNAYRCPSQSTQILLWTAEDSFKSDKI